MPNGQHALVRWTAPTSGTFNVSATFTGEDTYGTTTDVEVLRNGAVVWQGEVTGYQAVRSYSGANLSLGAGDTLDFGVGDGTDGTFYNDTTGISVQISMAADTAPPTIACGSADGAWHASDVSISCTASDAGDGLANPTDASFTLATNVPGGTETDNASTATHQVCDASGNCATAGPITGNKVDKKGPSIVVSTPAAGATYALNAPATASYACSDAGSGVATCTGTVADGGALPTGTVGAQRVSVSAADNVGNASSASADYTVTFAVCALYDQSEVMPAGSVRPIKLELCDAAGNDASSSGITVHATGVTLESNDTSANLAAPGNANPDNDFRFDATLGTSGGYIYNLSTRGYGTGTYQLSFTVSGDPITHSVQFELR